VPVQGPFRNRPLDVGGASPSEPADRGVRHSEGPRDGRQCFVCLAPCNCLALLIAGARRRPGLPLHRHAVGGGDHRTSWSEAIGCPCASAKHLDHRGYFLVWRQAIIAGCSMIMAWLQTRFSTSAASSGSSAMEGRRTGIARRNKSRSRCCRPAARPGRSRRRLRDPSGVYPSPISSAPTGFTILAGSSNQSSRWDRACSSHCRLASDDGGAVTMSALLPQNRHLQLDRQCPESAIERNRSRGRALRRGARACQQRMER